MDIQAALEAASGDEVTVLINSPGGDMSVGGEIRSMLRRYSGRTAALYQGYGAYATDEMLTDAAFMTGFFGTAFALAADRLVWLMHPDAEELLPYLSIHSGEAAKFLWNPEGGLGAFDTQRVLNKPVLFEDSCSALGKKGDVNLIDPFQYILLTKGTAKQDWSIHVEFLTDQMCFRLGRQAVPGAGDRRGGGMTPERRAALLAYCRIAPGDLTAEEETLLEGLYGYAAGYMAQAGVAEPAGHLLRGHLHGREPFFPASAQPAEADGTRCVQSGHIWFWGRVICYDHRERPQGTHTDPVPDPLSGDQRLQLENRAQYLGGGGAGYPEEPLFLHWHRGQRLDFYPASESQTNPAQHLSLARAVLRPYRHYRRCPWLSDSAGSACRTRDPDGGTAGPEGAGHAEPAHGYPTGGSYVSRYFDREIYPE